MTYMELGWWLGHGFELVGIILVATPVALDLHRAAQSRPLAGDICGSDLVRSEEAFLGSQVRSLTLSLAKKDAYTEEHTRRVALRTVQVGEELGLSSSRLRELAIGALVHDTGKLALATSILWRPASLTPDEFDAIKRHPELGAERSSSSAFRARCGASCSTITSASTAAATPEASKARRCRSTRGSSPSATCTTR